MGDAYAAAGDDAASLFYNPAGLAGVPHPELGFLISPKVSDESMWTVQSAVPLVKNWGVFGAGMAMHEIGGIERRQNEFDPSSELVSREGTIGLGYAYGSALDDWSAGISAKYLFHTFSGLADNGRGMSFDFGGKYSFQKVPGLVLGVVAQNIAGRFRWSTGRTERVQFVAKSGASYRAASWLSTNADVDVRDDQTVHLHAGVEMSYLVAKFRFGADHNHPTIGFGLATRKTVVRVAFDYAFEIDPQGLGDLNRLAFSLAF